MEIVFKYPNNNGAINKLSIYLFSEKSYYSSYPW